MSITRSKIHQDYLQSLIFSEETTNNMRYVRPEATYFRLHAQAKSREVRKAESAYRRRDFGWPDKSHETKRKPCIRSPTVKRYETLQPYKAGSKGVPFELYIKPDPILRANPRATQKAFVAPPDEGRKQAQKTRPRLVMRCAASVDDIDDDETRDFLISYTYQSTKTRADRITMGKVQKCSVKAPLLGQKFAPASPVQLPKWTPPVVPPELRKDSLRWYIKSPKATFDANEQFWLSRSKKSKDKPLDSLSEQIR